MTGMFEKSDDQFTTPWPIPVGAATQNNTYNKHWQNTKKQ